MAPETIQKVDVHVLLLSSTNQTYWQECLKSLEDEPIHLHITEGTDGHVGKGRYAGFSQGSSPYVSCVDPDDIVIPGAFQACIEALEANPEACGAYTNEQVINQSGKVIKAGLWNHSPWNPLLQLEPRYLHHIYVMRRVYVERYYLELLRWPQMPEYILKCLLVNHGPWIHVNRFGYKWRLISDGLHGKITAKTVYAAKWRVIPTLQKAAKKYNAVIEAGGKD